MNKAEYEMFLAYHEAAVKTTIANASTTSISNVYHACSLGGPILVIDSKASSHFCGHAFSFIFFISSPTKHVLLVDGCHLL